MPQASDVLMEIFLLIKSLLLIQRLLRYLADLRSHASVLVHNVKSALHKLSSLQKVVDVVGEHSLSMNVTLNFEHELTSSHAICNL